MGDIDAIAKAFVDHYYNTFDTNRQGLLGLYQDTSMCTFEGTKLQGAQPIMQKLMSLQFAKSQHQITTLDAQPTPSNGILVMVSGNLIVENETNTLKFSQTFHLMPANNSWFVYNDIFRLNYG